MIIFILFNSLQTYDCFQEDTFVKIFKCWNKTYVLQ